MKFYYTQFVLRLDRELGAGVGSIFNPLFYIYDDEAAIDIDR